MKTLKDYKFYVSGPMTGLPEYNFPMFNRVTLQMRDMGLDVIGAHEVEHPDGGVPGSIDYNDYLRGDLIAMLRDRDAIMLLDGWRQSKGAKIEYEMARKLSFAVFEWDEESPIEFRWMK